MFKKQGPSWILDSKSVVFLRASDVKYHKLWNLLAYKFIVNLDVYLVDLKSYKEREIFLICDTNNNKSSFIPAHEEKIDHYFNTSKSSDTNETKF